MLHGDLPGAEQQARQACEQLERFQLLFDAGWGHYQLGEVRRRMGDLPAATEAFDKAYAYGHDPEPGLALLQLAIGDPDAAERSIQRALAERAGSAGTPDEAGRAELLPAQVEIAIARGDLDEARLATDELERIAGDFTFPVFAANASTARGRLLLAEGNVAEASRVLSRAWRAWQEADLPFESARTRVALAEALRAQGDESAAVRDLNAAREAFARLGAAGELRQVEGMLGTAAQPAAGHRSTKRTFMFTDIVTSTDLLEAIGDDAWEELIEWHDRTLRSAIAEHRGEEVVHTGDGFFAAFATAVDGVESAVDIQRRLARHRREHGFAPWVRIGLHTATATRRGSNYSGRGVHVASRVGAAADREEILVATSVIEAAETIPYPLSDARSLTLKGVQQPVEVRAVDWR
jgi:class 3 adenylate cyclase